MNKKRSVSSPLDWENGKNDGSFVRIRIASSADIVPQKWQTKTEITPPLLFLSSERWICDWSDGDFENGKFSIDDSAGGENYTLSLKFLSRTAPIDFQTWYEKTLKKQQVCLELTDANSNERVFNPFDVIYKFQQQTTNGEMTEYEVLFVRSKLIEQKDRIVSVLTDCETGITKFVFASGKPELYNISCEKDNAVFSASGENGFEDLTDGQYLGFAVLKNGDVQFLKTTFQVQCSNCVLSVTEIEEVFDCTLSITSIEEVTGLAGNQGKLVTGITI